MANSAVDQARNSTSSAKLAGGDMGVALSASQAVLSGVYVSLEQLLALRHKHQPYAGAHSQVVGNRAGLKLSKIKGRGVDFAEVRPYQPGDDVRAMDWRVTARKNKPHTKVFREERERPVLIALDQTQHMFFGSKLRLKSVAGAELAARIAWQNLAAGDRVGGIVIGNRDQTVHKPLQSNKAVARFLNSVTQFNQALNKSTRPNAQTLQQSMHDGMLRLRRMCRTNYRVFIISDFAYPAAFWESHLLKLARHNEVVLIRITDPLDSHLPPANHYAVSDGQTRLQFHTGESNLRERYHERFLEHQQALRNLCLHENMQFHNILTHDTDLDQLRWT